MRKRAQNNGQGTLDDVRVDVALAPFLEHVAGTGSCGAGVTGCRLGSIVTGQAKEFYILVRLASDAPEGQSAVSTVSAQLPADVQVDTTAANASVAIGASGPRIYLLPLIVGSAD